MNGRITKEWTKKADHDYEAVKSLIRLRSKPVYDIVCFHTQQCIEKYLKAYLTSRNIKFPKLHDLGELLTIASKSDGSFELIRDVIEPLSDYAVVTRYPGDEVHKIEAKTAVNAMEEARTFIRGLIR